MTVLRTGHGGGGRLSAELIRKVAHHFENLGAASLEQEDCALITPRQGITLDGFTVTPRFFPGGSLGKLAACGSFNDLAVRGMKPEKLLLGIIAEEGLEENELLQHMGHTAQICAAQGVKLIGGDTKVVPRGSVDGIFLTTCAVGTLAPSLEKAPSAAHLRPGDVLMVTGPLGRHGAAIAASRYNLEAPELESDCASLWDPLEPLFDLPGFRCARDATRGGVATVLCEWAEKKELGIILEETAFPMDTRVASLSDLLGLDPLYLACEGTAVVAVAPEDSSEALEGLRSHPLGAKAAIIGEITQEHPGLVGLHTPLGGTRIVDMMVEDPLPRIC